MYDEAYEGPAGELDVSALLEYRPYKLYALDTRPLGTCRVYAMYDAM